MQFFCTFAQISWKIRVHVKEFIFTNVAGLQPATLLKINFFTRKFQGFWLQVQSSYFVENFWMTVSVSVTFLLIFKNSYILQHFSVPALVYSGSRIYFDSFVFF